ncbi:hypothetical protein C1X42_32860, partial [Pseudomonas sp. FW305-BF8]|uniref:hypothetical protein n=1 Tax=Pseudomonas sp. FW305-BF8 TaxID=2070602 RepID=UPI000CAE3DB9
TKKCRAINEQRATTIYDPPRNQSEAECRHYFCEPNETKVQWILFNRIEKPSDRYCLHLRCKYDKEASAEEKSKISAT